MENNFIIVYRSVGQFREHRQPISFAYAVYYSRNAIPHPSYWSFKAPIQCHLFYEAALYEDTSPQF